MMILIFSNSADRSTHHVLNWLSHYGADYAVVYGDLGQESTAHIQRRHSLYQREIITPTAIGVTWYRRNALSYAGRQSYGALTPAEQTMVETHLREEFAVIQEYLYSQFDEVPALNTFRRREPNKLTVLSRASDLGLKVPDSLVCTQKQELIRFAAQYETIISKPLSGPVRPGGNTNYLLYTERITKEMIAALPEQFFPSFFQQQIPKQFEVRAFYLDGAWHCLAMFTQAQERTSVDSRKYVAHRPTRMVPFRLPERSKNQAAALMTDLGLNCGSLDFIVSPDNELYFLEVNPVGQFGQLSVTGNFRLEKKIAKWLIDHDRA